MLGHDCGSRGSSEKLCRGPGGIYHADKDCVSETGRREPIPHMVWRTWRDSPVDYTHWGPGIHARRTKG